MQQEVLDALFLAYTNFLIYRMIGSVMCAGMMACLCCHACNNARLNCLIKACGSSVDLYVPFRENAINTIKPGFIKTCFAFPCTIINC